MASKFFKVSLLWVGDGSMKDISHCVRHPGGHHSNSASVPNEKKLSIADRSIWTRHGSLLGWEKKEKGGATPLLHAIPWPK